MSCLTVCPVLPFPCLFQEMLPRVLGRAQALAAAPSEDVCRSLAMVFAAAACSYLPGILKPELAGHWGSLLQVCTHSTYMVEVWEMFMFHKTPAVYVRPTREQAVSRKLLL